MINKLLLLGIIGNKKYVLKKIIGDKNVGF